MTLVYAGAALLVLAQLVGIYALVRRTADLVFSVLMLVLLAAAVLVGGYGLYHHYVR